MSRPTTRLRRWIAAATTVIAMTTAGAFAVAGPAHAEQFAGVLDSFDDVPDDRWDIDVVSGQGAVSMGVNTFARTARNAAQLDASSYGNSVARITRTFIVDPNTNFDQCGISVYLRRLGVRNEPHPQVQVSMRIRQGGANGQILSARGLTIEDTLGYGHWAFADNFAYPGSTQRTLEIAAFRGVVVVDDLRITCGTR